LGGSIPAVNGTNKASERRKPTQRPPKSPGKMRAGLHVALFVASGARP